MLVKRDPGYFRTSVMISMNLKQKYKYLLLQNFPYTWDHIYDGLQKW